MAVIRAGTDPSLIPHVERADRVIWTLIPMVQIVLSLLGKL